MTEPEFTMDCPSCGLAIAAPTAIAQERPVWDPMMDAFRVRVLVGPNDVEYQLHVAACATDCACGHARGLHSQDGCLDKSGGGYFCACMETEEPRKGKPNES